MGVLVTLDNRKRGKPMYGSGVYSVAERRYVQIRWGENPPPFPSRRWHTKAAACHVRICRGKRS